MRYGQDLKGRSWRKDILAGHRLPLTSSRMQLRRLFSLVKSVSSLRCDLGILTVSSLADRELLMCSPRLRPKAIFWLCGRSLESSRQQSENCQFSMGSTRSPGLPAKIGPPTMPRKTHFRDPVDESPGFCVCIPTSDLQAYCFPCVEVSWSSCGRDIPGPDTTRFE
jgi:hypothetical protein